MIIVRSVELRNENDVSLCGECDPSTKKADSKNKSTDAPDKDKVKKSNPQLIRILQLKVSTSYIDDVAIIINDLPTAGHDHDQRTDVDNRDQTHFGESHGGKCRRVGREIRQVTGKHDGESGLRGLYIFRKSNWNGTGETRVVFRIRLRRRFYVKRDYIRRQRPRRGTFTRDGIVYTVYGPNNRRSSTGTRRRFTRSFANR